MGRTDERYLNLRKERYRKASRKEPDTILNESLKTTGYHRKYAMPLRCSNTRSPSAPGRTGRRVAPDSVEWIWSLMAAGRSSAELT
ncbi:MAG: hypothetical protein PVG25_07765, partial [Anaerolineae bacterium]